HGSVVATGQALDVFQRDRSGLPRLPGGLLVVDAQLVTQRPVDVVAAEAGAHGVGAHADDVFAGGLPLIHVVEGCHAVDLGLLQAEPARHEYDAILGDEAFHRLHQVQKRHHGTPGMRVTGDDLVGPGPCFVVEGDAGGAVLRHVGAGLGFRTSGAA